MSKARVGRHVWSSITAPSICCLCGAKRRKSSGVQLVQLVEGGPWENSTGECKANFRDLGVNPPKPNTATKRWWNS